LKIKTANPQNNNTQSLSPPEEKLVSQPLREKTTGTWSLGLHGALNATVYHYVSWWIFHRGSLYFPRCKIVHSNSRSTDWSKGKRRSLNGKGESNHYTLILSRDKTMSGSTSAPEPVPT